MATVTLATVHQGYGITGGVDAGNIDGFDLTPDMLVWAEAHGLAVDDPTVYLAVSADADADDLHEALAWIYVEVPDSQAAAVRAAVVECERLRDEAFSD